MDARRHAALLGLLREVSGPLSDLVRVLEVKFNWTGIGFSG
ncbi:hypothetical protein HNR49_002226 [Halobacterium salinarum]|uniref:Uncharacterized protein n=1 Tax=Halobacterium salinarum TaxID=2242 RepID=A0A841HES0_HALSI|nr:hypothetical protein [Halobacterium salinarum]